MSVLCHHHNLFMKTTFLVCLLFVFVGNVSGQKKIPEGPVVLQSKDLQVKIDRANGLPFQYLYRKSLIRGMDSAHLLHVVICRMQPRAYIPLAIAPAGIQSTADQADIQYTISYQKQPAASFHLRYKLNGSALVITMEQVQERKGFELIETSMADLATVREEDGPG